MPNPIIWTKMGSTAELDTPEFGSLITRSGFADFRPSKFDNGASGVSNTDYVKYSPTGMDATKGCIECWLKFDTQDIVNGAYTPGTPSARAVFGIGGTLGVNSLQFIIYPTGNGHYITIDGSTRIIATNINITKDNPYHVAVVWDNAGIGGSGEKLRLYVDNVQKASSTYGGPGSVANSLIVGNLIWSQSASFYSPSGYECSMDNLKAWDYAKTDFSDRFTEDGLSAAKRLFSNKYFGGI